MRSVLAPEIEAQRFDGPRGGGPSGRFRLLCPVMCRALTVVASDGRGWVEVGLALPVWEHVSVSHDLTVPTYYEMEWVREQFFEPHEWCVSYSPARVDKVNVHPNCLHLFRLRDGAFPVPPVEVV